jgi:hypothetical protein
LDSVGKYEVFDVKFVNCFLFIRGLQYAFCPIAATRRNDLAISDPISYSIVKY